MFAVIYRGYIPSENEEEYKKLWKVIASYFIENRGAMGSRLHKTHDGAFLAYSCWPDKKTRDESWPGEDAPNEILPAEIKEAIIQIRSLSAQPFEEIHLDVLEDRLFTKY
ncbi:MULTISPECIES: hypothetical protein [Legionella]|uniref:hypothetical protein n=1 Tax=Legionella TaxID=445 RepID=UPI00095B39B7|nr:MULTISPECIES: hypothetical protein [Legionella]MBN9226716.1 hypothetical protein [Legionella steelei]OJW06729.1 MAG: hypothetical protein BGO44_18245 [Legionella sp. 39-23]